MNDKSPAELREILKTLEQAAERKRFNAFKFFQPYPKQQQFLDLGAYVRERALMAGNQLGKTHVGAFEAACHLTGDYPDDWLGRRWDRPVRAWAACDTGLTARDGVQKKLLGEPGVIEAVGTGFIPKDRIVKTTLARGVADAYDTVQIRHKTGGISVLKFKSYEQGRKKFQSETLDFIWFDEEPPADIYSEGLTRIAATGGMVFCTFTPLLGRSTIVIKYMDEQGADRKMVNMTDEEVGHISAEQRARNRAGWLAHEVEARSKGIPLMGSGRVYAFTEESITEDTLTYVPEHWFKIWGTDFGLGKKFASVLLAWDKDADVVHVLSARKHPEDGAIYHANAMKQVAADVPVAWPHDGHHKDKGSGEPLAKIYRAHGLRMLAEHATHPTGGYSVEAGIFDISERFRSGRLKIGKHLAGLLEEYRFYHRKDGMIVKQNDHELDAMRAGIMMLRFAKQGRLGGMGAARSAKVVAANIDFDLF